MEKNSRIFVAGYKGLVGSAICRRLRQGGFDNLVLRELPDLDLRDQAATRRFFAEEKPEYVVLAAAKVGGILANATYPADFIYDNLAIEANVIDTAARAGVRKLLFLGSSCIYPKLAPQPMREEHLLTGPLEPTNEWYAIAKIAGIKLAQAYRAQYGLNAISLMPTNLYGPGDNFDLQSSHVLPALIRKTHEALRAGAPEIVVWGSGTPRREFLHVGRPGRRGGVPDARVRLGRNHQRGNRHRRDDPRAGGNDRARRRLHGKTSCSIRRSRTARRASCWMSAG